MGDTGHPGGASTEVQIGTLPVCGQGPKRWISNTTMKQVQLPTLALALTAFSALPVFAGPEKLNTPLGSFNGVTSYSNGSSGRWSAKDPTKTITVTIGGVKKTINTGYQWQCVEYDNRYIATTFGLAIAGGDAGTYYANAKKKGLTAYADGGKVLPQPGDLICWGGGGGSGHIAVVRSVGTKTINVIEQNRLCTSVDSNHEMQLTVTKDSKGNILTVKVDPLGVNSKGGYWTQGWLRK